MTVFIEKEREEQLDRIRAFCRSGGANGGILLVCGPRGCGKTRLVDEALNTGYKPRFWDLLFGDNHCRHQIQEIRPPRRMKRILFKVEVDPFFPHQGDEKEAAQIDRHAFQMLRNLVFALTSQLDPRNSQRRFGRTLRSRLGFWRYWFDPTGLRVTANTSETTQQGSRDCLHGLLNDLKPKQRTWQVLLLPILFFLILCVLFFQYQGLAFPLNTAAAVASTLLLFTIAWTFLRWLDWRALARFSSHLYDLVHAQDFDKASEEIKEIKAINKQQWNIPSILLTIAGLTILGLAIFKFSNPAFKSPSTWLSLLLGSGLLTLSWLYQRKQHKISHFGPDNPVWMITQLRRYLFLLHRAGIEPVLVFDELDKLEQGAIPGMEPSGEETGQPNQHPRLNTFIGALSRLRQMLAGDFVTILVGGEGLASAHEEAHKLPFPGVLGSIVQETVYLGPVSPGTVEEWWKKNGKQCQDGLSYKIEAALAWIHTQGLYARLKCYHNNWKPSDDQCHDIEVLANIVEQLWDPEDLCLVLSMPASKSCLNYLHRRRILFLIRLGMARQAGDTLFRADNPDSGEELSPKIICPLLKSTKAEDRIRLGRLVLRHRFREEKAHQNGETLDNA